MRESNAYVHKRLNISSDTRDAMIFASNNSLKLFASAALDFTTFWTFFVISEAIDCNLCVWQQSTSMQLVCLSILFL